MHEPSSDRVRGFLFESLDIRGAWVHLESVWQEMTAGRAYPAPAQRLLGELAAATSLIAAQLKQPGRLTFQLRGEGAVSLLVVDCTEKLELRGMVRAAPDMPDAGVSTLLGAGAALVLTLDTGGDTPPWQSFVPVEGDTLGQAFEHYLAQSEQTPTRLWLVADATRAAGLFIQALPGAANRDADGWNRVQRLAETVRAEELLDLGAIALLGRLFAEEDVRVFDPRPVHYRCPYDPGRIARMLHAVGEAECRALIAEQGEIRVHDEMCNHDYTLSAAEVAALFEGEA